MLPEPYSIPRRRSKGTQPPTNRVRPVVADEGLTGEVHGMDASDWEERLARALMRHDVPFEFREIEFAPIRTVPGAREVDFLIYLDYGMQPLMVDGEFSHKGISAQSRDRATDAVLNAHFLPMGYLPVKRVPDGKETLADTLETQEAADGFVQELIR